MTFIDLTVHSATDKRLLNCLNFILSNVKNLNQERKQYI